MSEEVPISEACQVDYLRPFERGRRAAWQGSWGRAYLERRR